MLPIFVSSPLLPLRAAPDMTRIRLPMHVVVACLAGRFVLLST